MSKLIIFKVKEKGFHMSWLSFEFCVGPACSIRDHGDDSVECSLAAVTKTAQD
jgi:hypothetical protein